MAEPFQRYKLIHVKANGYVYIQLVPDKEEWIHNATMDIKYPKSGSS